MDKYLKYTFNISKYTGNKGRTMLLYFNSFKKLKYSGFSIKYDAKYSIVFQMNIKLMRRLKLMNLKKDIKIQNGTIESKLYYFLNNSKEITEAELTDLQYSSGLWSFGTSGSSYISGEDEIDKQERKKFQKNQSSKIYSQKAKQYENKARFRK